MDLTFSNPAPFGTQCHTVIEQVHRGPCSNVEFQKMGIVNHTGRISDARKVLRPHGLTIVPDKHRGVVTYSLVAIPKPPPRSWIGRIVDLFA